RGNRLQLETRRQTDRGSFRPPRFVEAPVASPDLIRFDPVLAGKSASRRESCRHLIFRQTDELATKVMRRANSPVCTDVEGGVAKQAREKYRQREIFCLASGGCQDERAG